MPEGIALDLLRPGAKLAPSDCAVLIGVEPDRDIEIAQRNVPLAADRAGLADLDPQITVGGEVGVRRARGRDQRKQQDQTAQH